MKQIILIAGLGFFQNIVSGQGNIVTTNAAPVPYQFPNYAQNNSSYSNNSMQNNRPADIHSGPYTGNADYADPTRPFNIPYIYNTPANVSNSAPANSYIIAPPRSGAVVTSTHSTVNGR
jgi:hypothetical protein